MSLKFIAILLLASSQSIFARESDWEVINMAFDNILAANPNALANAFVNVASSLLPADLSIPPAATPGPATTAPNTQPSPVVLINPPATPAPQPQPQPAADPSSTLTTLFLLYPGLFQQMMSQPAAQPAPAQQPIAYIPQSYEIAVQQQPTITQILSSHPANCECRKKQNSLAEFEVNVPCPTTTEKPPKKIVVRVPCPTTTTTTEKPCSCQCCPCNPCKPQKPQKPHKPAKESSESEESREFKTIVRTYEHPKNFVRKHYQHASEDCSSEEEHKPYSVADAPKYCPPGTKWANGKCRTVFY